MACSRFSETCFVRAGVLLAICMCCSALFAQGPLPDAPDTVLEAAAPAAAAPISMVTPKTTSMTGEHRFWDTKNRALFATATAFNFGDFAMTHANLQGGGRELNPVVRIFGRSAPGLAINFGGETAGVMGFAYFLHKRGHHKLERAVSVVNIGASAAAIGYGWAHHR